MHGCMSRADICYRCECFAFDVEKLMRDATTAHAECPLEQMERGWEYKEYVMSAVAAANDGKSMTMSAAARE